MFLIKRKFGFYIGSDNHNYCKKFAFDTFQLSGQVSFVACFIKLSSDEMDDKIRSTDWYNMETKKLGRIEW